MQKTLSSKNLNCSLLKLSTLLYILGFVAISLWATFYFPGSKLVYLLFCLLCFILIPCAFIGTFSYFYFFLACFWILGFWFKACMLFTIRYPLIEPVGHFIGSPQAWNKAIIVSTIGLAGLLGSKFFMTGYDYLFNKHRSKNQNIRIPIWYVKYTTAIWLVSIIAIVVSSFFNYNFNIYKLGVIPTSNLPFKLNTILPCLMNVGFSFWLALLVWWDINLDKHSLSHLSLVIVGSAFLSTSILSRGLYLYQTAHYLISLFKNKEVISRFWKIYLSYILILVVGLVVTIKIVMLQRDILYPSTNADTNLHPNTVISQHDNRHSITVKLNLTNAYMPGSTSTVPRRFSSSGVGNIFIKLATERWIGLEGVMAVSNWPDLNEQTFYNGWTQRLAKGTANPYPAISEAIYFQKNYPGKDKFFFSSLPGLIAMSYYAGNTILVFLCVFIITFVFITMEKIISVCLKNPFISSFFGIYMAMLISMLNDAHAFAAQSVEVILLLVLFYIIQSKVIPDRYFLPARNSN